MQQNIKNCNFKATLDSLPSKRQASCNSPDGNERSYYL